MDVFTKESDINKLYKVQEVAGGCLWKLKPRYNRHLNDDIRNSLRNWNVSVEELPWYLAYSVGIKQVINQVNLLAKDELSDKEKQKTDTILYWLSARNVEDFKSKLNHKWKKIKG